MEWGDERYVKVYTRDSLTWRAWKWETRTLLLHFLRKADNSGFIETGRMDPVDALSLQLELPREVVSVGLEQMLEDETAKVADRAVLLPKFVEAQEARKTEGQKKRDHRERVKARRLADKPIGITRPPVHPMEPSGTGWHPPSPSPSPSPSPTSKSIAPAVADAAPPKPPKPPPDPRLKPLTEALVADFAAVGLGKYLHGGAKDAAAIKRLLAMGDDTEIRARWKRGLASEGWKQIRTLAQLAAKWNEYNDGKVVPLPAKRHTVLWK